VASMTTFLSSALLNHLFAGVEYTPAPLHAALFTSDPTAAGLTASEVSGGGYARQAMTFSQASSLSASNNSAVQFSSATAPWGSITHVGLMNAATGGDMLYYGPLNSPANVQSGDSFVFNAGAVAVSINRFTDVNSNVSGIGTIGDYLINLSTNTIPYTISVSTKTVCPYSVIDLEFGSVSYPYIEGGAPATPQETAFSATITNTITNSIPLSWTASGSEIDPVSGFVVESNGNIIWFQSIESFTPLDGQIINISPGSLAITLA
jgi:hypothetical protein